MMIHKHKNEIPNKRQKI